MNPVEEATYTPHVWANAGTEGAFPLNAARANEIEAGITSAVETVNELITSASEADVRAILAAGYDYPGRNIADIPEIQDELEQYGSVPAFLNARALARNSRYLRIKDYVDITHSSIGGTRRHRIGAFWPYYNAGDTARPGHIVMVPDTAWPNTVQWFAKGTNQGTAAEPAPYIISTLHEYELGTILPTFPTAWQNVMQPHRALLETRYSASGNLNASTSWAWKDLGKIWSPSETEVYGQVVWGTANGYSVGFDCQFPIFYQTRDRIKGRVHWWLRSASGSSASYACNVDHNGHASHHSVTSTGIRPLPCFLVGAN